MLALGATVPGLHGVCLVLPVDAKWPLSVGVHSAALVRLVALECEPSLQGSAAAAPSAQYEPGVHGSLTSLPGLAWKVPASHLRHRPMLLLGATVPGLHILGCDAPPAHTLPAGQLKQSSEAVSRYVPRSQKAGICTTEPSGHE